MFKVLFLQLYSDPLNKNDAQRSVHGFNSQIINTDISETSEGINMLVDENGNIGFAWQGFGSRGATGVASVRSC